MTSDDICCPKFNPEQWDETEHVWNEKLFIMDTFPQFLHMPLPNAFGKTVTKMWDQIEKAGAKTDLNDFLMLTYDPSPWKSELYINTSKEVPGANNVRLSGTYITKVFDGPFSNIRNYIKEFEIFIESKNEKILKLYLYFTYCPKCAKKYGHNYIVAFAQVR